MQDKNNHSAVWKLSVRGKTDRHLVRRGGHGAAVQTHLPRPGGRCGSRTGQVDGQDRPSQGHPATVPKQQILQGNKHTHQTAGA